MDMLDALVASGFMQQSLTGLHDFRSANFDQVLQDLGRNGTDLTKNREDPFGDGDQRPIYNRTHAQMHRNVWSAGGDTHELFSAGAFPQFIMACMTESYDVCKSLLEGCVQEGQKRELLESRHSILRLTALALTAVGYRTVRVVGGLTGSASYLNIVKLLLEHGARPDARDICGKTIVHYCMGPLCIEGDRTLIEVAALCIARAHELNLPSLVNGKDRFGDVPMIQVVMCNRIDLATFLCVTHSADVSIADNDGASPFSLTEHLCGDMRTIVRLASARALHRLEKHKCDNCQEMFEQVSKCAKCKIATYCGRDCQVAHWPEHKHECRAVRSVRSDFLVTTAPPPTKVYNAAGKETKLRTGDPPKQFNLGDAFDVKVQITSDPSTVFMLYNEKRDVHTVVGAHNCARYLELYELIKAFAPCDGRKAYMRARVTEDRELAITAPPLFVRKW